MTTTGLSTYHLLGRTGLRVSPLALGAMTFGNQAEGWGADKDASRDIFGRYVEAGGNFVDTANAYSASKQLLGEFLAETGWRDQLVLATKFTGARHPGARTRSGTDARTSSPRWTRRYAGCAPTTSTCAGCMCGTGSPRSTK